MVAAELKNVDYFSATTDMWSSHSLQPYLCYTIHFVGNDWELKTRFLQTLYLLQDILVRILLMLCWRHWNRGTWTAQNKPVSQLTMVPT